MTNSAGRRVQISVCLVGRALVAGLCLVIPGLAAAQTELPRYSIAADASAGFLAAGSSAGPLAADAAALWSMRLTSLQRLEAEGWGAALSSMADVSSLTGGGTAATPTLTVYEAYARLDLGAGGQFFLGKRRFGMGLGSAFSPGDRINPRDGFWDQKQGFRGAGFSAGIGPDTTLKAALSLDRNLDAYAAGARARAAAGTAGAAALNAAFLAALGDASGPADPRLFTWAAGADTLIDRLQLAAAFMYSPGRTMRPSLGASLDIEGLILQAEGAVEMEGGAAWFGGAGARSTVAQGADDFVWSVEYAYNGAAGILTRAHYLLAGFSWTRADLLNLFARSLVSLDTSSALVACGATFYPTRGYDLEITGTFGPDGGFEGLASLAWGVGLAARVHF